LLKEGHAPDQVHLVGNVMIDTLQEHLRAARARNTLKKLGLSPGSYAVVTLHRPSNVDQRENLVALVDVLIETSKQLPVVFPIHPRTQNRLQQYGLDERLRNAAALHILPPLGYSEFLCLTSQAKVVVTDSGGLQEETTALGVPCLTMRSNTERPITVEMGTSTLLGSDFSRLRECLQQVIRGQYKKGQCPELWDGRAAGRIAAILAREAP
jgi:UDP-N-acetylglucosamine 2-epimerase (non-hydrolysing)